MINYSKMFYAGVDEAGRGTLIGRVYAAVVIWNNEIKHEWLKDSKKLTKNQRSFMKDFILEHMIDYGIGYAEHNEIDSMNISNATVLAMHRALDQLNLDVDMIFVDGNYFKKYKNNKHLCVVGGDDTYPCISAASILAKTYHDEYIQQLTVDNNLQKYDLLNNMGYGTKKHFEAIKQYGISKFHRKSFKIL